MSGEWVDPESLSPVQEAKELASNLANVGMGSLVTIEKEDEYNSMVPLDKLPSGGKFYGAPIMAQPFKVTDFIKLKNMSLYSRSTDMERLFNARVIGTTSDELLIADEDYILMWFREQSYTNWSFTTAPVSCPHCGEAYNEGFDLKFDAIEFSTSTKLMGESSDVDVTLSDGSTYTISLLRRKHIKRVESYIDKTYTQYDKTCPVELEELLYQLCVVDAGKTTFGELIKKINPFDMFTPKQ